MIYLSAANLVTSLYTAFVIFCVLGFMGHKNFHKCVEDDMRILMKLYPGHFASLDELKSNVTTEEYIYYMNHNFHLSEFPKMAEHTQHCDYQKIIAQVSEHFH